MPDTREATIAVAVESVQPRCPSCGEVLASEHRSWDTDCRPHLPWCYGCKKPVLAVFSYPQQVPV